MATIKRLYSDIDLNFLPLPVTGDIALSYDEQSVIRAIRALLLTNTYERPFQPNIGSNINQLLFEPITPLTGTLIKKEIESVIKNHEPRATLQKVDIIPLPDKNAFGATVTFYIGNSTLPTAVNLLLERSR
jgi:phage baseplate assembly protein W